MEIAEAKSKFVETWGRMSSQWGINKNMAHIHALLLSNSSPLSADNIVEYLSISRGSVCENIKNLLEWKLIYKHQKSGDRKVRYTAEKDMWVVFRQIVKYRKRKELDPLLKTMEELLPIDCNDQDSESFKKLLQDIQDLSNKSCYFLDRFCDQRTGNISSLILKLVQ